VKKYNIHMILYLFPSDSLERYIQVAVQLIFLVLGIYLIFAESATNRNVVESSREPRYLWRQNEGLLASAHKRADHQVTDKNQDDNAFAVCVLLGGIMCFVFWVMKNIIKDIHEFRQIKYGKDKEY
jgi:hypothetical protein